MLLLTRQVSGGEEGNPQISRIDHHKCPLVNAFARGDSKALVSGRAS